MAGWTNRGKKLVLNGFFANTEQPTGFRVMLCKSTTAPLVTHNVKADLTEIEIGNTYTTSGYLLSRNSTDFDTPYEDDSGNVGYIRIKDVSWTASGGSIPISGLGARYAVLLDTTSSGNVICWWDLTSDRTVSNGQTLTLQDLELRLTE